MRPTVAELRPLLFAMERVLQWVAPRGIVSRVSVITRSTSSSETVRGAPGRGSSSSPSQPFSRKRRRHLPTVTRVVPSLSATAWSLSPSAQASTMRARSARAVLRLTQRCNA